ncbi:MAG TPA: 3-methyladenine DNA glycosylase [Microbacterium sp.]|nr:3-methyladenine DNA glycosylase [Microbacterium sp.]HKT57230.1 3-methyladenine DNA glycosylase [Microbacterium sp.]
MTLLAPEHWLHRESAHRERADALTAAHRERTARGERHPVEDFLFTYYSYKPAVLRRWHPGAGIDLADAQSTDRAAWRWYRAGSLPGSVTVDAAAFRAEKGPLVASVTRLLRLTADRPASFGCFGLHEWAMVYRQGAHRHPVPLRLGQQATDAVVEAHDLRCTHFDAYRFFTDDAVPRNRTALSRDTQPTAEQPGCLHANMDVYKWAVKLGPLVPGELLLDAFELARDIRYLDMQASPYDMAAWAGEPVRIETPDGKAEYVRRQRAFGDRAQALRRRLLASVEVESALAA